MKYTCIKEAVTSRFGQLGKIIGRHPFYFIVPSFIITAVLSTGLININSNQDMNYLLYADRGKIHESKQHIKTLFPTNTSELFLLERIIDLPKFPTIYFINKRGGNMLTKDILLEIKKFENIAKNITVIVEGNLISYSDICAIVTDRCFENPISRLMVHMDDIVYKKIRFKYPFELDPVSFAYQLYFINFGGVKKDKDGYAQEAHAIRLMYPLDESNSGKVEWIKEWTKKFFKILNNYDTRNIKVLPDPFIATELELISLAENAKALIGIITVIMAVFCVINFITNNCVKSKPWLGIAMVVSAVMAIAAGFGLMIICGVEYIPINIVLPFLIIATEIDDAFVMVACWRTTNPQDSIEKRMEITYSNAAVSITLTTLTNFLSYCIAMSTQFPFIRLFSFYAATSIFFAYVFQITFFGGCLALSGYREARGVHPFRCTDILERFNEYNTSEDEDREFCMNFFAKNLSKLFSSSIIKLTVMLLYFINLAVGIWGVTSLNEGMNVFSLFPQDSRITESYRTYYKYFAEYTFAFHIVIDKTLDYSDPQVQKSIEDLMKKFKSHPNIAGSDMEFSWLKYFKEFQKMPVSKYLLRGYDLSQKQDFIDALKDVFLKIETAKVFKYDIVFNENYTEIISSRFFTTAMNVSDRKTEIKVLNEIQKIADESSIPITVYSFISSIVEQGIIVKQLTFQLFWQVSVVIFFVLFAIIPNLQCALLVAFCSVSIVVETVGYMSFWDINLDLISLITLILCMGFCVNYPTHICYSFLCSTNRTVKGKLKECLYHVGFPIIQGTLTTILGPLILLYNDMYFYKTFVKIVIIVAIQTAFHALFVIPIVISLASGFLNWNNLI